MRSRITFALLLLFVVATSTPTHADEDQPAATNTIFLPLLEHQSTAEIAAVPGQYVVTWKSGTAAAGRMANLEAAGGQVVDQIEPLNIDVIDVANLMAADAALAETLIDSYKQNPDVLAIEPNYLYEAAYTPNDPGRSSQWAWSKIQAYNAWDITRGSSNVVIAIVDTGIQLNHPDLDAKIVAGYDFVDRDTNASDGNGHGTHVAGTAAAETNNGIGGAGTCPNCRLMPVRVLNNSGSGTLSGVAQGITYAADRGAKVINLSLGGTGGASALQSAINYAWNKGVFVACAAGNSNTSQASYPAYYSNCFAVASTMSNDARSSFSNYGTWVEVAAPGSSIYSTYPTSTYGNLNGTSMATPHVAGLAGLLASQGLTNVQIRNRICSTSDRISGTGSYWTCGRINAYRAVTASTAEESDEAPAPEATPEPTPAPTTPADPTPSPDATETMINGGFEAGDAGWTFGGGATLSTEQSLTGTASVRLGGTDNATDTIEQVVVVPANGQLTFAMLPTGENDVGDQLRLEITLEDVQAGFSLDFSATNGLWYQRTVPLGAMAGRTVRITFSAVTNEETPTSFYLDDISLR